MSAAERAARAVAYRYRGEAYLAEHPETSILADNLADAFEAFADALQGMEL